MSKAASGIGDQLKEIIRSRGLTPYAVAKGAGLDRTTVTRWINGTRADIAFSSVEKIAEALGLRFAEVAKGRRR